jgi:outer membrane protein TolC
MFRYLKYDVFFTVMFAMTGIAAAQNGSAGRLYALEECIDIALQNNSNYRTAEHRVNLNGANVRSAWATMLPTVNLSMQSGRNQIGSTVNTRDFQITETQTVLSTEGNPIPITVPVVDPLTRQPIVDRLEFVQPTRSYLGHSMSLRYNQTLYDFGRTFNNVSQAKATFNSAAENLTAARYNVYAEVKQRYFELLKAVRLEQEYREAVDRSKEQLNRTQSMYEIGSVAQIDVYLQDQVLGQDEINFINQQNVVRIAQANLNVAMGRDPERAIMVADVERDAEPVDFSLQEALATAEKNSPELRSFEYDMQAANHGRKSSKNNFLPSIGVSATYARDNQELNRVYSDFGKNYFFSLGASLNWNIFNGFSDIARVQRETSNYNIAEENMLAQKRNLYVRVKQNYLNLEAYNQIAEINARNLRASEEGFRLAQERYRVGAGTQLEVTEAQVALTRARVQLVRSKYDAIIARAQLEAAMGVIEGQEDN